MLYSHHIRNTKMNLTKITLTASGVYLTLGALLATKQVFAFRRIKRNFAKKYPDVEEGENYYRYLGLKFGASDFEVTRRVNEMKLEAAGKARDFVEKHSPNLESNETNPLVYVTPEEMKLEYIRGVLISDKKFYEMYYRACWSWPYKTMQFLITAVMWPMRIASNIELYRRTGKFWLKVDE